MHTAIRKPFISRVVNAWNSFPGQVVEGETLCVFKSRLDAVHITLMNVLQMLNETFMNTYFVTQYLIIHNEKLGIRKSALRIWTSKVTDDGGFSCVSTILNTLYKSNLKDVRNRHCLRCANQYHIKHIFFLPGTLSVSRLTAPLSNLFLLVSDLLSLRSPVSPRFPQMVKNTLASVPDPYTSPVTTDTLYV